MRGARLQHPATQTGLTAPETPHCFPPAASLEETLCIWKLLLIYLPAGNNDVWFPGLQWNEAYLSSHPTCKIYLHFAKAMLGEDASIFKLLPKDNSIFSSDRLSQLGARNIPPSNSVLQLNPDAVNPQTQEPGITFQKAELMWVKGRKLVEDHEQVREISSKRKNIFRWQEKDNEETSFLRLNQFTFLENVHRLWGLGWKNIK